MITMIKRTGDRIIFQNKLSEFEMSVQSGALLCVKDSESGKNVLKDGNTPFCYFINRDSGTICPNSVDYDGGILTFHFDGCAVNIAVAAEDEYFTFEVVDGLPGDFYEFVFAALEISEAGGLIANGIPMTYQCNPHFFPNASGGRILGSCMRGLEPEGAKLAIVLAQAAAQKAAIKTAMLAIDPQKGIISRTGGPWGDEYEGNSENYAIVSSMDPDYYHKNLDFFLRYGVDQLDFHQGGGYGQGDFTFFREGGPENFRREIAEPMKEKGITCGLHTYALYIRYEADSLLSLPEYQRQLDFEERFTLSCKLSESATEIDMAESADGLSLYYGFFTRNSPFLLVDEEIIRFTIKDGKFVNCARGCCGTKAAEHAEGTELLHLMGYFNMFAPRADTPLFIELARRTADTYNRGGFGMIYLDALDGLGNHCPQGTEWYYAAKFVHEIVKNCVQPPVMEYSMFIPSLWPARGRVGAWDTPARSYKKWNRLHAAENDKYKKSYMSATLGWYNFYPEELSYPGNLHTKYQFSDDIDVLGSLMNAFDSGIVYNPLPLGDTERCPALKSNLERISRYIAVKKSKAVPESVLAALRDPSREFRLTDSTAGTPRFVEMHYERKKLYELRDPERNTAAGVNPFSAQTPFIRIESSLTSDGSSPLVLLALDENKELTGQELSRKFERELNVTDRLAMKVRIYGNNSSDALCIRTTCNSENEFGLGDYIIPLDFGGWREFILAETDNGDLEQYKFNKPTQGYPVYRSALNQDRLTGIRVYMSGECREVRMGDIVACAHSSAPLVNPRVTADGQSICFRCEIISTEYMEYDGSNAFVYDRFGNSRKADGIEGSLTLDGGCYTARLEGDKGGAMPSRAILTLGFQGDIVK